MTLTDRYGIGPYYGTAHMDNETRSVYQSGPVTIVLDHQQRSHHCELFAYVGNGPMWFIGSFSATGTRQAERSARRRLRRWIDEKKPAQRGEETR